MRIVRQVGVALAAVIVLVGVRSSAGETTRTFKVVANPKVAGHKVPRGVLAQIYLGNADRFGDGQRIVAVDQSTTSPVRQAFSGDVLGMPVDGVKYYWLRSVGAGKRPPMIKGTDEEVIAFVAAEPGGIGYVTESTPVPATVRVISVE